MNSCTHIAKKIVKNVDYFSGNEFSIGSIAFEDLENFNQLPKAMLSVIKNRLEKSNPELNINFCVEKDVYYMYVLFHEGNEIEDVNFEVTKDEMVMHLANILETNQKNPNLEISDGDDRCFSFRDLKNEKKMKFYFPDW